MHCAHAMILPSRTLTVRRLFELVFVLKFVYLAHLALTFLVASDDSVITCPNGEMLRYDASRGIYTDAAGRAFLWMFYSSQSDVMPAVLQLSLASLQCHYADTK